MTTRPLASVQADHREAAHSSPTAVTSPRHASLTRVKTTTAPRPSGVPDPAGRTP